LPGKPQLEANYGVPMRAAVERYGLVGELEAFVDRAHALAEAGVEHLVLASPFRGEDFDAQFDELAKLRERGR
jgi:hypothetical protein